MAIESAKGADTKAIPDTPINIPSQLFGEAIPEVRAPIKAQ